MLIRAGGNQITDIDAVIFDHVCGELALFQLKWQDFFTNDVKQLRSRAKNFTQGVDSWTRRTGAWVDRASKNKLVQTLRLKIGGEVEIKAVHLFGLAQSAARMEGYGFSISEKRVAVATWPQFSRARYEIGPVDDVLRLLHERLAIEMRAQIKFDAMPLKLTVAGTDIKFEDLWCSFEG